MVNLANADQVGNLPKCSRKVDFRTNALLSLDFNMLRGMIRYLNGCYNFRIVLAIYLVMMCNGTKTFSVL